MQNSREKVLLQSKPGNGQFVGVIICVLLFLFVDIFIMVAALSNATTLPKPLNEPMILFMLVLVFLAIDIIILVCGVNMRRTYIDIYQSGVSGRAITKSPIMTQAFSLKYDAIQNVDRVRFGMVIHTQYNEKYTCYISNSDEIRNLILQIKNK